MTKKDLFRLIIKIFGLYSLVTTLFGIVPANISLLAQESGVFIILAIIGLTILILSLFVVLIFKSDFIIDKLKLDKGFDDDIIDFPKFNDINILKISLILIGAYLMIDNIPTLLIQCFKAFKSNINQGGLLGDLDQFSYDTVNYFTLVASGISVIIGYLMITNYKTLIEKFVK